MSATPIELEQSEVAAKQPMAVSFIITDQYFEQVAKYALEIDLKEDVSITCNSSCRKMSEEVKKHSITKGKEKKSIWQFFVK